MSLEALVHHVCEKTSGLIVHVPDVDAVYQQILSANASKYPNVLLLPEYNGHESWTEELAWITSNFGGSEGIPIMLDVFGGGSGESPTPQLSTSQITDARSASNVQWLRFAEVISWHLEHEQPFPTSYVADILSYCQTNNLKLYWCEWKIDYALGTQWQIRTFDLIRELIEGYEDLVFVGFKTNSGDLEPQPGFSYIKAMFESWGGTVESWYWETRHRTAVWEPSSGLENPDNMPISWMVTHANQARSLGAQILQLEPYWYFFDKENGQAKPCLKTLHNYLNSNSVCMDVAAIILQTLKAEWLFGPEKEAVAWLWGRASTVAGWDIQPSTFDFSKITKRYAVSCYNLTGSSGSNKMWLKTEVVAVDLLVKVLGTTLEKACFARDLMQVEVERILAMYSRIAPLWDPNPGPTGAYKHRRIPGVSDVVISQAAKAEDERYARVTLHVTCRLYPQKVWVGGN